MRKSWCSEEQIMAWLRRGAQRCSFMPDRCASMTQDGRGQCARAVPPLGDNGRSTRCGAVVVKDTCTGLSPR
jgi:hypothetical protein